MKKKLNVAIVGAGGRGISCFGKHLASRRDCTISAICDINEVRGKLAAEKLNVPVFYADLKQMLKKEKPDAVIITTPDAAHEECAVTALKHKVNVLIDKPLATSVKGCKHIIREAEKSGKTVMMGFNLRHAPLLVKLKEIVDEGVLGKVFLIENREFYDGGRTYMVFTPDGFPFTPEKGKAPGPACAECRYAKNGLCKDASPRQGEEWGKEAQKKDGYVKDSCMYLSDLSVHDNGFAVVEYENGTRACHMECFVAGMSDRFYTVVGTHGLATLSLSGRTITVTKRWGGEKIVYEIPAINLGGHAGADPRLVESFLRTIQGLESNRSTIEQGMLSTAIGEAAELSREENRVVFLKELLS